MFRWYVSPALLVVALLLFRNASRMPEAPMPRLIWRLTVGALLLGCAFSAATMPDGCARIVSSLCSP